MGVVHLIVAGLLAASPPQAPLPCTAGPTARPAIVYLPNPAFIDVSAVEALPHDRLYILIDDAVEVERDAWEDEPPIPPTDRPTVLYSEDLVPLARKSVHARGQTIRGGDTWAVWFSGKRFSVKIREFAINQDGVEPKTAFDEVYAIATIPAEVKRGVGAWDGFGLERGKQGVLLAAPFIATAVAASTVPPAAGPTLTVDRSAFVRDFRASLTEENRPFADQAQMKVLPVSQCGERRVVAVLNLCTNCETDGSCKWDYGCGELSALRVYDASGAVLYRSGILWGGCSLDVGDVNGDGSDEILVWTNSWGLSCDVLSVRDGAIVRDHYELESGC